MWKLVPITHGLKSAQSKHFSKNISLFLSLLLHSPTLPSVPPSVTRGSETIWHNLSANDFVLKRRVTATFLLKIFSNYLFHLLTKLRYRKFRTWLNKTNICIWLLLPFARYANLSCTKTPKNKKKQLLRTSLQTGTSTFWRDYASKVVFIHHSSATLIGNILGKF